MQYDDGRGLFASLASHTNNNTPRFCIVRVAASGSCGADFESTNVLCTAEKGQAKTDLHRGILDGLILPIIP